DVDEDIDQFIQDIRENQVTDDNLADGNNNESVNDQSESDDDDDENYNGDVENQMPKTPEKVSKLLPNLNKTFQNSNKRNENCTNGQNLNVTTSTDDHSDKEFENAEEITRVDTKLISDIIEFILNGNSTRRSLSVLILAVLKKLGLNYRDNEKFLSEINCLTIKSANEQLIRLKKFGLDYFISDGRGDIKI
ncbi:hypothetical protein BpHYR1_027580, partial [Brachionus plicatilis]